jgi:hypothetical protein
VAGAIEGNVLLAIADSRLPGVLDSQAFFPLPHDREPVCRVNPSSMESGGGQGAAGRGHGDLGRPVARFQSGFLSALPILVAFVIGLMPSGPQAAAGEHATHPASPVSSKIHPSLRVEFSASDGNGVKAWIYFERTKGSAGAEARAAALSEFSASYPGRAVERRRLRRTAPGLFDERDLPVPGEYLRSIEAIGVRIHVVSRWLSAASARATPEQIERVAALSFVERVEPVRRGKYELPKETPDSMTVRLGSLYGQSAAQLQQIHLTAVHDAG